MTFEEMGGQTLLVKHDLYPSKEALDGELASGAADGMPEQFDQLDEFLVTLGGSVGGHEAVDLRKRKVSVGVSLQRRRHSHSIVPGGFEVTS